MNRDAVSSSRLTYPRATPCPATHSSPVAPTGASKLVLADDINLPARKRTPDRTVAALGIAAFDAMRRNVDGRLGDPVHVHDRATVVREPLLPTCHGGGLHLLAAEDDEADIEPGSAFLDGDE